MNEAVLSFVGQLIAYGGSGGLIGWGAFKFFGERWLDHRYEQRLATERHARAEELERLRGQINRQLDRVTKLSQREFEVLPDIWAKLVDAFAATENSFMKLRRYRDLDKLDDGQVHQLLADEVFHITWSQAILAAEGAERTKLYVRALEQRDSAKARDKAVDAYFAIARSGVFLPADLHQQLRDLQDLIWRAVIDVQFDQEHSGLDLGAERPKIVFANDGRAKLTAVEELVRSRLTGGSAAN